MADRAQRVPDAARHVERYDRFVAAPARRLLPDVTLHITAGAGHGLLFQHPEPLSAAILDFVESRETGRPRVL